MRHRAARHIPGVSGHELAYVANRHFSIVLLNEAIADLVNAHARLDISQASRPPSTCTSSDHRSTWSGS
ncbi:Tn3 family transposase [Streptomyces sp. NPDC001515]